MEQNPILFAREQIEKGKALRQRAAELRADIESIALDCEHTLAAARKRLAEIKVRSL